MRRHERGEGLSGLPVVCRGESVTSDHLLAVAEARQGKASGTQALKRCHIQTFESYIQVSDWFGETQFQALCSDDYTTPSLEVHSCSDRRHQLHRSVAVAVREDRRQSVGSVTASPRTPLHKTIPICLLWISKPLRSGENLTGFDEISLDPVKISPDLSEISPKSWFFHRDLENFGQNLKILAGLYVFSVGSGFSGFRGGKPRPIRRNRFSRVEDPPLITGVVRSTGVGSNLVISKDFRGIVKEKVSFGMAFGVESFSLISLDKNQDTENLMVVLSLQVVQFRPSPPPQHFPLHSHRPSKGNIIRCGIAEPSGEPAPLGQKTKYNDGFFERAFMTLFARKMEKFAAPVKAGTETKKNGWWDHDYESFVEVSKRVMQGRSRMQQQQVVREVLLSMLPPGAPAQFKKLFPPTKWAAEFNAALTVPFFQWLVGPSEVVEVEVDGVKQQSGVLIKKCRYLENSGCVGMCVNMCKFPTQDFFTNEFGLPLTMIPNFEDMSCEMVYGQVPPPFEEDPVSKQPCYADICSISNPSSSVCPKLQA
ncbi:hypothetical protein SO802_003192 [Lithocarpus litseifolius]|uniref:Beta-carotene isomerase D27-like C-terminal domain-containing protein n=1 Tax=Lithocarpus litseifolius TaxID=425828 RepID=A0AAW2E2V8_9ROSI